MDAPWHIAWHWTLFEAAIKGAFLVFAFLGPIGGLMTWQERKQISLMQDRVGPNRAPLPIVGWTLAGIPHFIADGIKMVFKEDFQPAQASRFLFQLAPIISVAPAAIVWAVIPFGDGILFMQGGVDEYYKSLLVVSNADAGLLVVFAFVGLGVFGTVISGYASDNKLGLLGSMRAGAQMISYEVTLGLSIMGVLLTYATLNLSEIVARQDHLLWGWLPAWGILYQPLGFLLFFAAAYAETKRGPFDMPEGESEIVGYFVEYSGMKFGMFMFAEYIAMTTCSALLAVMFLGGHHIPWISWDADVTPLIHQFLVWWENPVSPENFNPARYGFPIPGTDLYIQSASAIVAFLQFNVFVVKVLLLNTLQIGIRWSLPRFRYDQLMDFGWKFLLPLSLLNLAVTVILLLVLGWPA